MDWSEVELRVYSTDGGEATGWFALPDGDARKITVPGGASGPAEDPTDGRVQWRVIRSR
jgi:hypothetical protein